MLDRETKITWLRPGGPESIRGLRFVRMVHFPGQDSWLPFVHNFNLCETIAFSTDDLSRVVRIWFIQAHAGNLVDGLTDEFISDEYGGIPVRPEPIQVCRQCEPPLAEHYVADPATVKREMVLRAPSVAHWQRRDEQRRAALVELAQLPQPAPSKPPPPPPAPSKPRSWLDRLLNRGRP